MKFDHRHYVPCLRWKQGEYQAVLQLPETTKNSLTPLIEVPEIGFDFEARKPSKLIDDHLQPFAKRVKQKWGEAPCFVDLGLIDEHERTSGGEHPIVSIFDELRDHECSAVPVTGIERDPAHQSAVAKVAGVDGRGVCVRVSLMEAAGQLKTGLTQLLSATGLSVGELDLVLDLGAPNFNPIEGFAKAIHRIINGVPQLHQWRTFSIIGTSFPASMAEIKTSPTILPRYEWALYQVLAAGLSRDGIRIPTFGDYGVNHPDLLDLDMRLVKPAASIRYTIDDGWYIVKGKNVRDNGYGQYRDHCRNLIASSEYMGTGFSFGDDYIHKCASGTAGTGNLTTWRKIGTNHHLQKVVKDVANFFASSGSA